MKFKIDENLPDELAQLVRDGGWDCSSVVEQNLGGTDDPRPLQKFAKQRTGFSSRSTEVS